MLLDLLDAVCPYCGELFSVEFDASLGKKQIFEEDCHVCCKCITIELQLKKSGKVKVKTFTEDGECVE
jgi:Cysteine-rich CPXCG